MNKTVLIIDDDDLLRHSLAHGLGQFDYSVLTADSAEQAAQILKHVTPNAIILDRMMTGTDGLTFLKQLRKDGNTTPVLMLTALSGPENTIDGLSNGANDYLAKPFQLQELVLRLKNILKTTNNTIDITPKGLIFIDNEFFIKNTNEDTGRLLALSSEEKKLLKNLINPIGNTVAAPPMVAKRLRMKINDVLSNLDITTIRGRGYKLIEKPTTETMVKNK